MLDFKANMCLHYSCADRTANLQCYLHASSAPGGHPANTELSLDSQSKRCTYINNIKNVNLWKCRIYFYKQRGQQCSSWEQKKAAKDTAHGNKRAWMSSVLSLQTSHQTGGFFSLPHLWKHLKRDVCGMRETYIFIIFKCRRMSYFSLYIWLQMEPTEKNKRHKVHSRRWLAGDRCKPSEPVIKWVLTTLLPTQGRDTPASAHC